LVDRRRASRAWPLLGERPAERVGCLLLMAVAFALPFELDTPLFSLGPIHVTNLELTLGAFLLTSTALLVSGRLSFSPLSRQLPGGWPWLAAAFVFALAVAAWLAPGLNLVAWKAGGRTLSGLALAALIPVVIRRRSQAAAVLLALLIAGIVSATFGLVELTQAAPLEWLGGFRPQPSLVGPFVRLTGTLDYANQAAMYIGATLPLLAAGLLLPRPQRKLGLMAILGLVLAGYLQAGLLTYSRALPITVLGSFLAISVWMWRSMLAVRPDQAARVWIVVPMLCLALVAANALLNPVFLLRMTSASESDWYRWDMQLPGDTTIEPEQTLTVDIRLHNLGVFTWSGTGTQRFQLVARWFANDDAESVVQEQRWPLPAILAPGEHDLVSVELSAPANTGDYFIVWDVVHEGVSSLSYKTGQHFASRVTVTGAGGETEEPPPLPAASAVVYAPDRLALWSVAGRLIAEYPWTGIGLDTFRLRYGRYLGWSEWNTTIHSNSLYLETMVSLGFLGALPFFAWLAILLVDIARTLRRTQFEWLNLALGTSLLAFMVHGVLDYFLLFNATGLLFWVLVGLWIAARPAADRVTA
jgi:hypothetical protein